jgi:mono/diheme cytochrome c family protein
MKTCRKLLLTMIVFTLLVNGCSKESDKSAKPAKDPDWVRGRAVYIANCVACHNPDPSKDGPIGPANKGSSQELIEARVLRGAYPPNYKPKRNTKVMPQFPYLKSEIPYLAAFLGDDHPNKATMRK